MVLQKYDVGTTFVKYPWNTYVQAMKQLFTPRPPQYVIYYRVSTKR